MELLNNKEKLDILMNKIKIKTKIRSPASELKFKQILNKVFRYFNTDINNYETIDKNIISYSKLKHLVHEKHLCFISHIITHIFGLEINPDDKVEIKYKINKEQNYNLDYISTENLDKMYTISNDKQKLILMILLSTGIRASGLCNITWENIDFDNNEFITIEKNNKQVTFNIVHDKIKELIIKTKLFNKKLHYNTLRYHLNTLISKCGLEHKHIHLHAFRHTFARLCLKNGMNYDMIKILLNHSKIETTMNIYVKERNVDASKRFFGNNQEFIFPKLWKDLNMIKV
ncbi:hypothetical protein MYSEV_153 [Mythimna separata entomopoxvirus 'L']|uniref:Tyr recombinase domain-containing protein n=1 Tax=Mythimna separata entomopoxvirus 'L' TaxID=1293572 RepID=A0A916P7H4_9POXV|nr:hypothetical protein MYSEV_153 [Mythimna separata entomopoxvirus 'L']CCU56351.1 hypothetical protein MYSEV_153 [Mythimna separata entomopoxvirus 'L']